jgi:hypothetical protein
MNSKKCGMEEIYMNIQQYSSTLLSIKALGTENFSVKDLIQIKF